VAAVFYKDIKSFIEQATIDPYDFAGNGFSVPEEITVIVTHGEGSDLEGEPVYVNGELLTIQVPTENGAYTEAKNNAEGGYIRGLELSYTQIYSFLPEPFNGLGISASYSFTESEIQRTLSPDNGVYSTELPGLSENVATATFFYEYEDFETRLSVRYRDAFVSQQVAINSQTVNFDSETVVDFQASYNINENLGVLFQVNNLTDEPTKSYFGNEYQTGTIQYFGTQYFFGLTYSM
jgi:TonB-dependent receptor